MFRSFYNKFRRITTNQLYFPEIDGIRFLAIVLVMLFHTHGYFVKKTTINFIDNPPQDNAINTFLHNGDRGVELFFVLSGFILCLPFAHHYVNKGKKVDLKKYYLRRVTRLEPPYFIAMTLILLVQIAAHSYPVSTLLSHWLASLAYSHDLIYHHTPMLTVVAWSLEIEIQFYLLAPIMFRLLALHKIIRRSAIVLIIVCLTYFQGIYPPTFFSLYGYAQYFLIGILLSDLYVSDAASATFNKNWVIPVALVCFIGIMYAHIYDIGEYTAEAYFYHLSFCFFIAVLYYAILKNDILKKIFSYKFIPVIGGMCYSIYLLHYTIISVLGKFTIKLHVTNYYYPNLILQTLLLAIPILIISSVFYLYIERPFMSRKWVDKLMKKDKHTEIANMQSDQ